MAKLDIASTRSLLQAFKFHELFIEELGWSQPSSGNSVQVKLQGVIATGRQIAELGGVAVFEIAFQTGAIPAADERKKIHAEIKKTHHENLLIFVDKARTESLWYWVKREDGKQFPRYHYYSKGQPGDLFLSKLSSMVIDLADFSESGDIHITEVVNRLKQALDVEPVIKRFYQQYSDQRIEFTKLISGIADDHDRKWYASIILNRLMFVYFLQGKGFLAGGNYRYLQVKLAESKEQQGKNKFFSVFLHALFFEGFAKPEVDRSATAKKLLGEIKYLNGGLFLPHCIEIENKNIDIPDKAFENLLKLFESFSWNLNDTPGGKDDDMNPDVLGYIFEKYINQKAFGAYYTRPEITEYLCERTIHKLILDSINNEGVPGSIEPTHFERVPDLLMNLDADLCKRLLNEVLPRLSLLDPACGSGAFLVAAMKTLIEVYSAVVGKIEFINDRNLKEWLRKIRKEHPSINYYIKKRIITDNLFGVDIMEEATEIARLRLFLALVASAGSVDELEPLPNIDFNIMAGNSLVGLMHIKDEDFAVHGMQQSLFRKDYHAVLEEKNRLINDYRHSAILTDDLRALKQNIEAVKKEAIVTLDQILLDEFKTIKVRDETSANKEKVITIKYEQATWDEKKSKEGKPVKRDLTIEDIRKLKPFHWGYEFDEIINKKGGFDAIITNPPWEIFKPNGKEFLEEYSDLITKKKMSIKEFEKEQAKLLKDGDIRKAWLAYQSEYPHVSEYYRNADQYKNQISIVNGKKAGTDINLYKLFTEQCFNLLKKGGECGIVIPSGIYTDLGTKQLREMLFNNTEITALYGLSNEKFIFEGLHHAFKFCLLTFMKNGTTINLKAIFRIKPPEAIHPSKLDSFLQNNGLLLFIKIDFLKKLFPDSLTVMEFKSEKDMQIVQKVFKWPLLGSKINAKWQFVLTREFDMTNDSHLFKTKPGKECLPLYEGKMIHQFTHRWEGGPRYWIDEKQGRKASLGSRSNDSNQLLNYQYYRFGVRAIGRTSDSRTLIAGPIPKASFCGHSLLVLDIANSNCTSVEMLFVSAVLNSFIVDYYIRQMVSANLCMFYLYQLPVPRLSSGDKYFSDIVSHAARLICTTPEFDDLAREIGIPPLSPLAKGGAEGGGIFFDRDSLQKRGLVWNGKHLPYNPNNIAKARELRKNMTSQERKLWYGYLRNQPVRFIRQRPVDHYILDFYCAECRLAIEIDGSQHYSEGGEKYDRERSDILSIYKVKVLRFTNREIDEEFEAVCRKIAEEIPPLSPLKKGGAEGGGIYGVTDPAGRAKLRAELDGIIANLYELTEDEFKHILSTFPLVDQSVKDAALEQYRVFAPKSSDQELAALIKAGEGHTVEFKESSRWDRKQNKQSKVMEEVIVESGAAFLNSDGGTLLIGVKDDGSISGLKHDYKTLGKKQNRDGFENWLTGLLLDNYKKDITPHIAVSFHDCNGEDVCRLTFKKAHRPVFIPNGGGEAFYIRAGNSKRRLKISEAMEYCKQRWPE